MRSSYGLLSSRKKDVDYIKTPLAYETTGAFGKEAKKWFKKVQLQFFKNNGDTLGTLGGLGYASTWSANSFTQCGGATRAFSIERKPRAVSVRGQHEPKCVLSCFITQSARAIRTPIQTTAAPAFLRSAYGTFWMWMCYNYGLQVGTRRI